MICCFPSTKSFFHNKGLVTSRFSQFNICPKNPTVQYIYSHIHPLTYPPFHPFILISNLYTLPFNYPLIQSSINSIIRSYMHSPSRPSVHVYMRPGTDSLYNVQLVNQPFDHLWPTPRLSQLHIHLSVCPLPINLTNHPIIHSLIHPPIQTHNKPHTIHHLIHMSNHPLSATHFPHIQNYIHAAMVNFMCQVG